MLQNLRSSLRAAFSAHAGSWKRARGFTLIEVGIVLVVIGLVLSGGLLATGPVIKSAKISETRQKMGTVEAALLGYVISNGCLPCPAVRGSATTGVSHNGTAAYTTACGSGGACTGGGSGLVPWVTLGISENEATDGWNRRMTYAVDPALTDSSSDVQRNASGSFPTFTSALVMQNLSGTSLGYTSIAYILVSHGPNMFGGESVSGNTGATPTDTSEVENADNDVTYRTGAPSGTFDDILEFKSLQPLIISCGTGSCGNPS
ncbi:MAG: type II secretion system protein [Rhodospirillaceae bacterium]|nr:type II secretion system protein [Rhodospirillaceae bacterium]